MSSGLFALLAVGTAASAVGCAKPEEEKKTSWACTRDEVPMGEVIRCTSSAVTADGPTTDPSSATTTESTPSPTATALADGEYTCDAEHYGSSDCPPPDATGGDGSAAGDGTSDPASSESGSQTDTGAGGAGGTDDGTSDSTSNPAGSESGTNGSSGNGAGGSNSSGGNAGGNGNGNGNGHTTDGSSQSGSQNGNGNAGGGTSHQRGPDECSYVPDLDYCNGAGGGSSSPSSSGSSGSSGVVDGSSGGPPGQDKKGGTSDSAGASSSSGGGGGTSDGASSGSSGNGSGKGGSGKGGGKTWKCSKDDSGNKTCVSTPECAPGTHASACGACESDSDGPTCDCVPPTEGGCWITGGGFIEGASLVPAAAADGHDNFGGNAKPMKKGGVSGHWNHVDHGTGNHAKGRPEYIMCRVTDGPGPKQPGGKKGLLVNQVYFGGHAQWRDAASATWSDGYWFDVVAEDHGEPGNTHALKNGQMPDSYHFTIRKIDDTGKNASGTVVYETKDDLRGGNIQIHPSNPGHPAVSSPLPAWVSIEQ